MPYEPFEVGEGIGGGSGTTDSVEFHNPGDHIGQYGLKIGSAGRDNFRLRPNESRDHSISKSSWNAKNNGKVDLEYEEN